MEVFKVRNSEGLFWEGHSSNRFTKKGKVWKQINHVKCALTNASPTAYGDRVAGVYDSNYWKKTGIILPNYLTNCEIVKFELKEVETIKI